MNYKFKCFYRLVVISIIMTLFLVGCAGEGIINQQPGTKDRVGDQQEEINLTWWTSQRHDMEYMKEKVDQFNEENTHGITIDYVIQSDNFRQDLDFAFQSNQAPDMFTGPDLAKYYDDKGLVEPLNQYLTQELKARYGDMLTIEGVNAIGEDIFSLPNTGITYRLVYNKDLFKQAGLSKPPESLDQLIEYAKIITQMGKEDGVYGFAGNFKNAQAVTERSIKIIGCRSGMTYYDKVQGQYDFRPFEPIIMAFKQIVDDGSIFPGYESLDIDPLRSQFAQGKIGMYFGGAWEPGVYNDQFKTTVDWGAAPVPTINGEVKGAAYINGLKWLYMSSDTEHKDAVWKVFEYFNSDDVQVPYAEKGLGNPVVPSVIEKAQPSQIKGVDDFAISELDAVGPPLPQGKTIKVEGKAFYDVFVSVIRGQADYKEEVLGLNERYNAALEKAIASGATKDYQDKDFKHSSLLK